MKLFNKNIIYQKNGFFIFYFLIVGFLFFHMHTLYAQTLQLGWDPSTNPAILSYNIYRAVHADSSFSLLGTVMHPDSIYFDNKLQWNTHYFYVATSVDKFGMESGFSNIIDTTLQSIVPVELYSLSARIHDSRNIILEWQTTSESNNYGFEVQRLCNENPGEFTVIGFVKGNGTTANAQNYHYVDKNLPQSIYHYRLKQIDFDGSFKFSDTVQVTLLMDFIAHLYQNYPNPFNKSTEIKYDLPVNSHVDMTIYDQVGRKVYRLIYLFQTKGQYAVKWDAKDFLGSDVGSGIYYYKIKTDIFTEFRKMVVIK